MKASFNVDPDVLKEFRALVARKYGKLWRVCGKEVTEALRKRAEELRVELEVLGEHGDYAPKVEGRQPSTPNRNPQR